jgi:c-di-GMP-binding flagellar brake protein YcgR
VGDRIVLQPSNKDSKGKGLGSQIVGYRPGDFIIIDEPKSPIDSSDPIEDLTCVCFREGVIYYFCSRIRKHLGDSLVLLDYPEELKEKKLRSNPRIRVNSETKLVLIEEERRTFGKRVVEDYIGKTYAGTMVDVSEGGCMILLRSFSKVPIHALFSLDFILPDGQAIEGLEALVINSKSCEDHTYEVGLKFRGPMEQLGKVFFFCQLGTAIQGLQEL